MSRNMDVNSCLRMKITRCLVQAGLRRWFHKICADSSKYTPHFERPYVFIHFQAYYPIFEIDWRRFRVFKQQLFKCDCFVRVYLLLECALYHIYYLFVLLTNFILLLQYESELFSILSCSAIFMRSCKVVQPVSASCKKVSECHSTTLLPLNILCRQ